MKIDTLISELRSLMLKYGNVEVSLYVKCNYYTIENIAIETYPDDTHGIAIESESAE